MKAIHSKTRRQFSSTRDMRGSILSVSSTKPAILGTGLIALDVVVGHRPGDHPHYWAGGTCGNVLTILAYFGWRSYPAGTLGNDVAADKLIEDVLRFGVQTDFLQRSAARRTPIIVEKIRLRPDGTPRHSFIWTCPTCGASLPGYRAILADQATAVMQRMPDYQVFFFDRVSRVALRLAHASAQRGALVMFEPNGVKAGPLFRDALAVSHIIKYSHERVGPFQLLDACEGRKLEIQTLGDEGLRYRLLEGRGKTALCNELGPYPVNEFKDAAGAGDWCTAGILHSLARQGAEGLRKIGSREIECALNLVQALAALKCRYEGPRGIMYAISTVQLESAVKRTLNGGPLATLSDDLAAPEVCESVNSICPSCPEILKQMAKKSMRS